MSSIESKISLVAANGILTGLLTGFGEDGAPMVTHAQAPGQACAARSVIALSPAMLGAELVLMFEGGDWRAPVIMGALQPRRALPCAINLESADTLALTCGKASIRLQADGKIIIEGEYVISRAAQTNRIEGGAVQIN